LGDETAAAVSVTSKSFLRVMNELNLELSALADIFSENEFEVIRAGDFIDVSFPLPFRLELQFNIVIIDSETYDITVRVVEFGEPLLELVERASSDARIAAEKYLMDRYRGEHRHLYSAHQRALDAFNKCISSDRSTATSTKFNQGSAAIVRPISNDQIFITKPVRAESATTNHIAKSYRCIRVPSIISKCICCTH
jgi:hypothetical protein